MLLVGLGGFGAPELMIILAIILLLFGASRLSGLGRSLGQSIVEFRRASREPDEDERKRHEDAADRYTSASAPPASVNGVTDRDYRSSGAAPAPPQRPASRPPDFTGR